MQLVHFHTYIFILWLHKCKEYPCRRLRVSILHKVETNTIPDRFGQLSLVDTWCRCVVTVGGTYSDWISSVSLYRERPLNPLVLIVPYVLHLQFLSAHQQETNVWEETVLVNIVQF